jgi:hypothetical protein
MPAEPRGNAHVATEATYTLLCVLTELRREFLQFRGRAAG